MIAVQDDLDLESAVKKTATEQDYTTNEIEALQSLYPAI